jgi:O-antigen/teichoic acid export membrane protein/SAM-dependent methyltransferase
MARVRGILRRPAAWAAALRDGSGPGARAVRGGAGILALKVVNRVVSLAVAVLLARQLGPEHYGVYAYALALVALLSAPVKLGLPTLLVREVATYQLHGQRAHLLGVLRRANEIVAVLSVSLVALLAVAAWPFAGRLGADRVATLAWAMLLLPLGTLGSLRGAALRGLRRVVEGELPEKALVPGLLLGLVLAAGAAGVSLDSPGAMALHVVSAALAFLAGAWLLRRALPGAAWRGPRAFEDRRWLASALPLAFVATIRMVQQQTDVLMLGLLAGATDVGVYRVVLTGSQLVAFAYEALSTALGPHAARLHASGDTVRLQRLVTWNTRAMFAVGLPVAVTLVAAGGPILGLVFGDEFRRGHVVLAILCLAQLVNVGTGSASLLLNMTGHERVTAVSLAWSAAANVALNALLIPSFGMAGAAMATATTVVGWNLVLWRQVVARLDVDPSVLHSLAPAEGRPDAAAPDPARWVDAAAAFADGRHRLWRAHSDRVNRDLLDRWLGDGQCGLVLKTDLFDEAVGSGLWGSLSARARRVIGMDVSVETARRARPAGGAAVAADVRRLPFARHAFDTVVSISTLDHFDSAEELTSSLAGLADVLRPGGRLVVTLDNLANPKLWLRSTVPWSLLRRTGLVPYYVGASLPRTRLRRELEALGFEVVAVRGVMHAPRITAVAVSRLRIFERARWGRGLLAVLAWCEALERLPTRFLTAHFVAVLAVKAAERRAPSA